MTNTPTCPKCGEGAKGFICADCQSFLKRVTAPPAHSKSEMRRLEAQGIPVSPPAEPTMVEKTCRELGLAYYKDKPERPQCPYPHEWLRELQPCPLCTPMAERAKSPARDAANEPERPSEKRMPSYTDILKSGQVYRGEPEAKPSADEARDAALNAIIRDHDLADIDGADYDLLRFAWDAALAWKAGK